MNIEDIIKHLKDIELLLQNCQDQEVFDEDYLSNIQLNNKSLQIEFYIWSNILQGNGEEAENLGGII